MPKAFLVMSLLGWLFVANPSFAAVLNYALHDLGVYASRQVQAMIAPLRRG